MKKEKELFDHLTDQLDLFPEMPVVIFRQRMIESVKEFNRENGTDFDPEESLDKWIKENEV